jgi:hypothetical protein
MRFDKFDGQAAARFDKLPRAAVGAGMGSGFSGAQRLSRNTILIPMAL